ncbi:MAG: hypothetical protein R3E95_03905 [Thiolinea sp.]
MSVLRSFLCLFSCRMPQFAGLFCLFLFNLPLLQAQQHLNPFESLPVNGINLSVRVLPQGRMLRILV